MAFLPADFMFHSHEDHHHDHSPSTSLNILPPYHPQDFHGVVGPLVLKRSMSFSGANNNTNNNNFNEGMQGDDDFSDDGSQAGEKKKIRLNLEQVKALEKSFELGNKLEPDRKMQLARSLNLQPRQVAIWFQNRRARWKTKVLERDYDLLKKQFEAVKAHNETLQAQNKKLHAEIVALRSGEPEGKKESTEGYWSSNVSENSPDLDISTSATTLNINTTSNLSFKQLFPSSFKPTNITQLLQGSSRSDHLPCPKIIDHQMAHDHETFSNMFSSIDDQTGLWPWPEQHHF